MTEQTDPLAPNNGGTREEAEGAFDGEVVKRGKLRLTNGYPVKFDLLARLLALISDDSRGKIPAKDLAVSLGVADNHMEFLAHISHALGLTQAVTFKATPLGKLVAVQDTFFDDIGTLWFLHYVISSEPNFLVWNRFANSIMPKQRAFTVKGFRAEFEDLRLLFAPVSYTRYVNAETRAILDTYTNQQFSKLAYLRAQDDGYSLGYRQPVPLLILAAAITRFRDQHQPGNTAVSIRDLLTAPNSPGVVFQMPEDTLRAGLEQLRQGHGFSLEARADLDQLRLAEDIPDHRRLERYYASR
jgi:hypothetical protein